MARKIPIETPYIIFAFLICGFILIFSLIMANFYGAMLENATFSAWALQQKVVPILFPNLLYYSMIYCLIIFVGLFAKNETQ
jgi:hypothetical protein